MLALSIKTIQKLVRDKQMVAYRIGGRYLIKESDLIETYKINKHRLNSNCQVNLKL